MKLRELTFEFIPPLSGADTGQQTINVTLESSEGVRGWLEFQTKNREESVEAAKMALDALLSAEVLSL